VTKVGPTVAEAIQWALEPAGVEFITRMMGNQVRSERPYYTVKMNFKPAIHFSFEVLMIFDQLMS
jgi:hypothetical protein